MVVGTAVYILESFLSAIGHLEVEYALWQYTAFDTAAV
jgi:hypothetical protein